MRVVADEGNSAPQLVERLGPMPGRPRMVTRTRRIAFVALLTVAILSIGLGWLGATWFGPFVGHLGALAVLSVLAWFASRRSTSVVEALFRQEDRVMTAVAHEARRPLSRLLLALDEGLSGSGEPGASMKEAFTQGKALNELIEDLLEAGRVMTGSIPLDNQVVRLDEVAAGLATTQARGDSTVDLEIQPVEVVGSPRLLRLGMTNLVRNAAQHAYEGGPGVIGVRVDAEGVKITDDGPGMDEAALAELRSTDIWVGLRNAKVGLGLGLSGWIADIHDGILRLDNRPSGGLEAHLDLPARPVAQTAEPL